MAIKPESESNVYTPMHSAERSNYLSITVLHRTIITDNIQGLLHLLACLFWFSAKQFSLKMLRVKDVPSDLKFRFCPTKFFGKN